MHNLTFIQRMHSRLESHDLQPHEWEIRSLISVGSTNSRAEDMLGLYDRVIILSRTQTQGRGRGKNIWFSPSGGLWMSLGFLTDTDPVELSSPVIEEVHKILSQFVDCEIKEPNDILVDGQKLCGILVEGTVKSNRLKRVIVGVGINIDNEIPEEVEGIATRLADHVEETPEIDELASKIAVSIIERLRPQIPEL